MFDFNVIGKIIIDPKYSINKKIAFSPWWSIVKIPDNIIDYYRYLFEKQYDVKLTKPKWGAHVSFIRGEEPKINIDDWNDFHNKKIKLSYSHDIFYNHDYVWLKVKSNDLLNIREHFGLQKEHKIGLHITVGKFDKQYYTSFNSIFDLIKMRKEN